MALHPLVDSVSCKCHALYHHKCNARLNTLPYRLATYFHHSSIAVLYRRVDSMSQNEEVEPNSSLLNANGGQNGRGPSSRCFRTVVEEGNARIRRRPLTHSSPISPTNRRRFLELCSSTTASEDSSDNRRQPLRRIHLEGSDSLPLFFLF